MKSDQELVEMEGQDKNEGSSDSSFTRFINKLNIRYDNIKDNGYSPLASMENSETKNRTESNDVWSPCVT